MDFRGHMLSVAASLLFVSTLAWGEAPRSSDCKTNPHLVGACYVVHGRATYGNGTPALRVWIVGSKRMLGVTSNGTADDADESIVPKQMKFDPSEKAYGDFEVCPFTTQRSGAMQMVCVASVKKLSFR